MSKALDVMQNFKISAELREAIRAGADAEGRTVSDFLRRAAQNAADEALANRAARSANPFTTEAGS